MDLGSVMQQLETGLGSFCQADIIPKKAAEYSNRVSYDFEDTAIVIQGPLDMNDDFTLETVKLYRKWYPKTMIIVSTWNTESEKALAKIEAADAVVLRNAAPVDPGYLNINMQLTSSANGVLKAKELGAKYIMKTRTDQRFCNRGFLDVMHHHLHIYPVKLANMSNRIITLFAFPHISGYVCDFMYFGSTEDIEKLLCIPAVSLTKNEILESNSATELLKTEFSQYTLDEFLENLDCFNNKNYKDLTKKCLFPEAYIIKHYMQNALRMKTQLKDYYKLLKDGLVIIDSKLLGFYWRKRQCAFIKRADSCLYINNYNEILYTDWLRLYLN